MGLDFGTVRIGIALSDETKTIAFGKETILNDSNTLRFISDTVKLNDVSDIVIGYPLTMRGDKSESTIQVEKFEEQLKTYFESLNQNNITLHRIDERLTSKMAADSMLQSGMKKKKRQDKSNLDVISATLLLQNFLDTNRTRLS